jgi:hypothetical protein
MSNCGMHAWCQQALMSRQGQACSCHNSSLLAVTIYIDRAHYILLLIAAVITLHIHTYIHIRHIYLRLNCMYAGTEAKRACTAVDCHAVGVPLLSVPCCQWTCLAEASFSELNQTGLFNEACRNKRVMHGFNIWCLVEASSSFHVECCVATTVKARIHACDDDVVKKCWCMMNQSCCILCLENVLVIKRSWPLA